ncbi:MAG: DUF4926 domain-containing protein [Desulfobacteraceae bacterium]|nr:DUF4926 domain-containing protein [Desulfobacteraceae bacterium]
MKLLDIVALTEDMPDIRLYRGQVGTIVEKYESDVFEVKFSDTKIYYKNKQLKYLASI